MFEEMRDIFITVLKLAEERSQQYETHGFKGGKLSDYSEYEKTKDYQKYNEKESMLEEYLSGLSFEEIKVIQTIMYLGRDGDFKESDSYEERYESIRNYFDNNGWVDKRIEIGTILEKLPLDRYLRSGFEALDIKL